MTEVKNEHEGHQCITERWLGPNPNPDRALMGAAHATSGAGFGLLILGVFANQLMPFLSEELYLVVVLQVMLTIAGAALVVDLDNTASTVRSRLGLIGQGLSFLFRESSRAIQFIIKTKRDDSSPNPHRGFWHSLMGAAVLGLLVFWGTTASTEVTLPLIGAEVTVGAIIAFVVASMLFHLTIAGLAGDVLRKLRKTPVIGELAAFAISAGTMAALFIASPVENYNWVGFSVFIGAALHILGDALTVAGVPIWFPIPIKGKFWWKTRFAKFKADDPGLNKGITILSVVVGIIGVVFLIGNLTS